MPLTTQNSWVLGASFQDVIKFLSWFSASDVIINQVCINFIVGHDICCMQIAPKLLAYCHTFEGLRIQDIVINGVRIKPDQIIVKNQTGTITVKG